MATIGQIVYNLEDYHTSGGYISTSKNGLVSVIKTENIYDSQYTSQRVNIFENIVEAFNLGVIHKLGIQAPPGTRFLLDDKRFMMGRTGIYELDENIKITSLLFEQPKNFVVDEVQTNAELQLGVDGFNAAEQERANALLNDMPPSSQFEDYWAKYQDIQDTYTKAYRQALGHYKAGLNGCFREEGTKELYNIIIDFVYEERGD